MPQQTQSQKDQNEVFNSGDGDWLTAKAVMDTTGIAKDDLVRFIQLNVLPRSLMRVRATGRGGARKKSYFSATLLGHVAMLKLLRDEGHSVETIARQLGPAAAAPPGQKRPSDLPPAALVNGEEASDDMPLTFPLPASTITGSAFFVNPDMFLGWVKVAPDDGLFKTIRDEMDDDPTGTVFDILLRASLKELVFNWQPLFAFIYRFLEETTPPERFRRVAPLVSLHLEESDGPVASFGRTPADHPRIDSCPIRIEDEKGRTQTMRLYAMALSEGALFIFEKDRWPAKDDALSARQDVSEPNPSDKGPDAKTPFSVISARLDNAQRLVDTLLPESYYRLITRIWNETDRIVASYGGQRSKRNGTDVQYIIPRHAGTDPALDAIRCAVEMRAKVRAVEESLKAKGRWVDRIRLNIGISSGRDYLPEEDLTASVAFMLPGGAADQAFHLSAIARDGGILITKSAFRHLSQRQMDGITFGIYHDNHLIPKIFAQVSELPQAPDTAPVPQDIRALFVTCIVDLRTNKQRL